MKNHKSGRWKKSGISMVLWIGNCTISGVIWMKDVNQFDFHCSSSSHDYSFHHTFHQIDNNVRERKTAPSEKAANILIRHFQVPTNFISCNFRLASTQKAFLFADKRLSLYFLWFYSIFLFSNIESKSFFLLDSFSCWNFYYELSTIVISVNLKFA